MTMLRPEVLTSRLAGFLSTFPAPLVDEVRDRVALLAGLMFAAFSIDLVLTWVYPQVIHDTRSVGSVGLRTLGWINAAMLLVSACIWRAAKCTWVSTHGLHTIGLVFGVSVCYVVAGSSLWREFIERGYLPTVTWVPALVLLFPLLLPGPPRRMLAATIAAGTATPVMLIVLQINGLVHAGVEAYVSAVVGSVVAVALAHLGARTIYGLGREAAASRDLGSYSLEEKLGEGGMGEVWRARHRLLARPAAIKLIRNNRAGDQPAIANEDEVRRFEREARATANLRSPHTVELFDFGVSESGDFYYAMELLDGLNVETLVRQHGPLPPERVVHIVRQMCHSLSEAASCGLVHRDIKPANIFLCRYGEDHDFVKVLDFGLVKSLREEAGLASTVTQKHVVHGTPAFIAPEQVLGAHLDGRADIYATGCVAYWMLTGQLVFPADTPVALALHHAQTPPAPPSTRTEQFIPPNLEALVMACLAKDPAARPQSARELSGVLAAIRFQSPWTEDRARKWWTRHEPVCATCTSSQSRSCNAGVVTWK